jgi:anti-sigma factor RsiW
MSCEWQNRIAEYIDGELESAESTRVQAHLHGCASCAAEAVELMQLKRSVRAAANQTFTPSAEFRRRISNAIGSSAKTQRSWLPQLAFATAIVAIIVVAVSWPRHSRPEVVTEITDLHVATLASSNPVDVISTDRHTVKPWFEGKLPFTFDLPELQNSDFRLIGGRMAYIEQSPGAQLVFGVRKHQMSVFIFQERDTFAGLGAVPKQSQNLAFNLETWADRGLRYVVISDASSADVRVLSQLLRSAKQ